MQWLRLVRVGSVLCLTYTCLAALISAYLVPSDRFALSCGLWLGIFAFGTWRYVALGFAARKRLRERPGTRLEFIDETLLNVIGIVGAGPFGATLVLGGLNQPPADAWKGLLFGALGILGAILSYIDLGSSLRD
ncbi:MAG: hypothetical protein KC766_33385 [Myxococcales bacterium]|nr:hypothetical protein [Myxococcales bacterium]